GQEWLAGLNVTATKIYWLVDPPPGSSSTPDTTITSGPADGSTTNSAAASFDYVSDTPGVAFECQLDSGGWSTCSPPTSYSGLADGSHLFEVRANDAGTVDPTPATLTWTVDTTPPDTFITGGPAAIEASGDVTFSFDSDTPASTFECQL